MPDQAIESDESDLDAHSGSCYSGENHVVIALGFTVPREHQARAMAALSAIRTGLTAESEYPGEQAAACSHWGPFELPMWADELFAGLLYGIVHPRTKDLWSDDIRHIAIGTAVREIVETMSAGLVPGIAKRWDPDDDVVA
ncbi:MAG: hypothetical protein IT303_10855 [Dehalococcoidia bacterium]|nr:hypothetical protein [Dehalococcoidia bacterium]